jgi:uncharacterized Zn-finger protein
MASTVQYPASPTRPFSCDMCALSFNRQHDLKRHRDTHSGEKPFLCNGGCGKTFTRKDALKRHQVILHNLFLSRRMNLFNPFSSSNTVDMTKMRVEIAIFGIFVRIPASCRVAKLT